MDEKPHEIRFSEKICRFVWPEKSCLSEMAVKQKWKYLVEDGEKINQSMEIDQFEMQVIVPCLGLIPQFHPVEGEVNSQSHIESYSSPCRFKFDPLGQSSNWGYKETWRETGRTCLLLFCEGRHKLKWWFGNVPMGHSSQETRRTINDSIIWHPIND